MNTNNLRPIQTRIKKLYIVQKRTFADFSIIKYNSLKESYFNKFRNYIAINIGFSNIDTSKCCKLL